MWLHLKKIPQILKEFNLFIKGSSKKLNRVAKGNFKSGLKI
jgi:hypothetical protein